MMDLDELIQDLPDIESVRRFFATFSEKHPSHYRKLTKNSGLASDVATLVAYSPLLASTMLQHPDYVFWLQRKRGDSVMRNKDELLESLARFSLTNSQIDAHTLLSRFRRRELLRIYLRDIRGLATIAEITEEISNLADAILEHALRLAKQELDNRYGGPLEMDEKGRTRPAEICLVSLGKLGSKELNYSSDIDLLFIYSAEGKTAEVGTREAISNREYFIKLAEQIIKLVGQQVGEGAAYRVDLRLRPHGRVGPLALSQADTVRYYMTEAAAWERQVLIRSRSSAGKAALFKEFFAVVEDRIFPKDGSVEEALRNVRDSKQKIDLENINAKGTNVKLGRGGIREIEFIAQALQLAHGGRDKWLRVPHTLISLSRLADRKLIDDSELTKLVEGYAFLRQLEHIIQMENGLQTHSVPNDASGRAIIGERMGFNAVEDFDKALALQMANVHSVFRRVFSDASIENAKPIQAPTLSPQLALNADQVRIDLLGMSAPNLLAGEVLRISPRFGELLTADETILRVIPKHKTDFRAHNYSDELMNAIAETNELRSRLGMLRREWHRLYAEIIAFDTLQMVSVRHAKDLQTELAEASIAAAIRIANDQIVKRFGTDKAARIAIMALGKLGGSGVDYDSDLDLVATYDDAEIAGGGSERSSEIASKSVEIFVNALSAMTREGSLYRVDLRLRPHGKDGPLAVSRSAFAKYMKEESAIWEMLAFVKLRGVGGDIELAASIESEIRNIIHEKAKQIPHEDLAAETRRIRAGLEKTRSNTRRGRDIDIKYGEGGMLDVYFVARFLQLKYDVRDTVDMRSTEDTLNSLREIDVLNETDACTLLSGYKFLSRLDHSLRLTVGRSTRLPMANKYLLSTIVERLEIDSIEGLLAELTDHRIAIRACFDRITQ